WGTLVAPQRGHRLRDGRSRRQALARRLRLLALEVFFLGTAMTVILDAGENGVSGARRPPTQPGERSGARPIPSNPHRDDVCERNPATTAGKRAQTSFSRRGGARRGRPSGGRGAVRRPPRP